MNTVKINATNVGQFEIVKTSNIKDAVGIVLNAQHLGKALVNPSKMTNANIDMNHWDVTKATNGQLMVICHKLKLNPLQHFKMTVKPTGEVPHGLQSLIKKFVDAMDKPAKVEPEATEDRVYTLAEVQNLLHEQRAAMSAIANAQGTSPFDGGNVEPVNVEPSVLTFPKALLSHDMPCKAIAKHLGKHTDYIKACAVKSKLSSKYGLIRHNSRSKKYSRKAVLIQAV